MGPKSRVSEPSHHKTKRINASKGPDQSQETCATSWTTTRNRFSRPEMPYRPYHIEALHLLRFSHQVPLIPPLTY
jgi:hypothetical protein